MDCPIDKACNDEFCLVWGCKIRTLQERDRLRGLLREVHTKHWPFLTDGLHERVHDAINGVTADQPPAAQCSSFCCPDEPCAITEDGECDAKRPADNSLPQPPVSRGNEWAFWKAVWCCCGRERTAAEQFCPDCWPDRPADNSPLSKTTQDYEQVVLGNSDPTYNSQGSE